MKYLVSVEGRERVVEIDADGISIDGRRVEVDVARVGDTAALAVLVDGRSTSATAHRASAGAWRFHVDGRDLAVEVVDERTARIRELSAAAGGASVAGSLKAPMPGLVVKVEVSEGEEVEKGRGLIIVEAMKMENELKAATSGKVERILVAAGDAVEKDQVLIEFAGEVGA